MPPLRATRTATARPEGEHTGTATGASGSPGPAKDPTRLRTTWPTGTPTRQPHDRHRRPPASSPRSSPLPALRPSIDVSGPSAAPNSRAGRRAHRRPELLHQELPVPPFLLPVYQAAACRYGIPWEVLAAINEIETDYGRNANVSSAGAIGWMQFMPATWKTYGVDANRDGVADPRNPIDAVFAAARYLRAAGAEHDLREAVFAYNHAQWYVDSVLRRARLIAGQPERSDRLAHRPRPGPLPGRRATRPTATDTRAAESSRAPARRSSPSTTAGSSASAARGGSAAS